MQSNNGKRRSALLGVAVLCAALMAAAGGSASAAPTETVLYSFTGGSDGAIPLAGVIADSSGNLFGTASRGGPRGGGSTGCFGTGCGTVFKLAPGGNETVLHAFTGSPNDGAFPAGLIADSSGNLYGTAGGGGANDFGAVFKLSPGGTETVLYSFCSRTGCSDGVFPFGLIADSSGNLFGTTSGGGGTTTGGGVSGCAPEFGCGVVFKLSPDGTETVLYAFTGGSDGLFPAAGLIADSSGNLFGTTRGGGSGCPLDSDAAWCSSSRRAAPRRCCTPLRAVATGLVLRAA